jgi:hypothetical protein
MYNLKDVVNYNRECRIYIAGPMTGLPDYNYPKFLSVEADLKKMGYKHILNPARIANGETGKCYSYYIRESLNLIKNADAVVFLNGWEKSKGANLEHHCSTLMGLKTFDENYYSLDHNKKEVDEKEVDDRSICEIADHLVSSDRQSTYGHPYDNFKDIGRVWGMILDLPDIDPEKVGLMMAGVKIAREKFLPKRDNLIDLCGYAKTVDLIQEKKKELDHE